MSFVMPTTADEFEDFLSDPARVENLFTEKKFGDFIKEYANVTRAKDQDIDRQVNESVQRTMAAYLKDLKDEGASGFDVPPDIRPNNATYRGNSTFNRGALYNKNAPGAALDKEFSNSADYLRKTWHLANEYGVKDAGKAQGRIREIMNSFGSTVPADGGFLIPEVLRSQLLQVALEGAVVRPRATVVPMESLRVPIPMIDSTSNVSSVFGGIVAYWTEEAAALTESQASFGRVVLDAKKLTLYAEMPNELIADATAFAGFFDQMFPKACSFYEDYAFMRGTGVGEPLGFINCPAVASVAAETGQPSTSIVYENIVKMYARMLPSSLASAVWIASIDTFPQLATMALSVGTGGSAVWMGGGGPATAGAVATPPVTILGCPVFFTEKAPTLGTTGDLAFVDLSYYLIGDRQVMSATSSPHYRFANDKTVYRIIERVDGRPWLQSAITPKNNGNALSPFVQLASRP